MVTLIPSSSRVQASFDLLFVSFVLPLASRNKVKRAGLTRAITTMGTRRNAPRERTFLFFSPFFLFVSIYSESSPLLTNFFSLTLTRVAFYRNRLRGNLYIGVIARAQLPYSRSSIDLFRDPRLLLEIDSDISAPGGLLKLHTFLGSSVVYSRSPLSACIASLFAFLSYLSFFPWLARRLVSDVYRNLFIYFPFSWSLFSIRCRKLSFS